MKTRDEIFTEERELLRVISLYKTLYQAQIQKLFPLKSAATVDNMLRKLARQKRIFVDWKNGIVSVSEEELKKLDRVRIVSFWLLLEFMEKIVFHTTAEFPAQIFFMTEKDAFEILYVTEEQEAAINAFFLRQNKQDLCKRLVIVENSAQIIRLSIPAVSAYATVSLDGNISYFKY